MSVGQFWTAGAREQGYDDTTYQLTLGATPVVAERQARYDPRQRSEESRTGLSLACTESQLPARGLRLYSFLEGLAIWRAHNDSGS